MESAGNMLDNASPPRKIKRKKEKKEKKEEKEEKEVKGEKEVKEKKKKKENKPNIEKVVGENSTNKEHRIKVKNDTVNKERVKQKSKRMIKKIEEKRRIKKLMKIQMNKARGIKTWSTEIQGSIKERATKYLLQWQEDRANWKFQKVCQNWLIRNMFHFSEVPSEIFSIFVLYMAEASGKARQMVLEESTKVVEEKENWDNTSRDTDEQVMQYPHTEKYIRARDILQNLSE